MKRKTGIVVKLLAVIAASVIGFLYWNSPDRRIRAVLADGRAVVTKFSNT